MKKNRNAKLDNVKALLIFLVVVGHLADFHVTNSSDMKFLYFYIYIFHMPLFVYLSGFFIKSTINSKRFKIEKVFSFFVLYVLLKIAIYLLLKFGFSNPNVSFITFAEDDVPWYLLAMAIWPCLVYVLKGIKANVLLISSFIGGLIIGYDPSVGDYLALSRIVVFFPFFLLGYYTKPRPLAQLFSSTRLKIASLFIIIVVFILVYINIENLYQFRGFLTGRNAYEKLNEPILGGLYRAVFYLLSLVMMFAVLILIPSKKNILTTLGERTLQIFILHMPILYILDYWDIGGKLAFVFPHHWLSAYMMLSVPLTLLLSVKQLGTLFYKIMNWKLTKMLKS